MRKSLKQSIEHSPDDGFESYRRGSIVLCNACGLPIYKLDRTLPIGSRMGAATSAFKPLDLVDLTDLMTREDVDPGVIAAIRMLGPEGRVVHIQKLRELRSGDPALCPICSSCFLQVIAIDLHEVLDRAYTVEMLIVPPLGLKMAPIRGKRLGATKEWLH